MSFPKMYIFGAPIELTRPLWYLLNSLKALASDGCPAGSCKFTILACFFINNQEIIKRSLKKPNDLSAHLKYNLFNSVFSTFI